uniref:Uncharacterized protein n=1 Tax=Anguilla anguilla TaxID=7936 RepID=A0A0E9QMN3_ANGAN
MWADLLHNSTNMLFCKLRFSRLLVWHCGDICLWNLLNVCYEMFI